MRQKLLIIELWGLGDLAIATPFIRSASEKFDVTLMAKPFAKEMRPRLWPSVRVASFIAPWTSFRGKYRLWRWPWLEMYRLGSELRTENFDCGVSGRWDPRDHFLLQAVGSRQRIGFPRLGSRHFLTRPLTRPDPVAHRSEFWRTVGRALDLELPARDNLVPPIRAASSTVLIHSGARLPARIWRLDSFRQIAERLRRKKIPVQIACDPDQLGWWQQHGENAACPRDVGELFALVDRAGLFFGNCSGPGHLAAVCGVPTFTIYGPSLHEWWKPMHPAAEVFEGRPCPYKPCSDYCRYSTPQCLWNVTVDEVWPHFEKFAERHWRPVGATESQLDLTSRA